MCDLEQLIQEATTLPTLPGLSATAHRDHLQEMTAFVDNTLNAQPNIYSLIGNNPLQMMYDNHRHHASFMATVFSLGSYALLARTLPWVYRSYHAHGFSYDYFPLELEAWIGAAEHVLLPEDLPAIRAVYRWMIEKHPQIIELSQRDSALEFPSELRWLEPHSEFRAAILRGDHHACIKLAMAAVTAGADIEGFYRHVLQPILYEVGRLWEKGEISVAQEHLASAIVSRVMASVQLCTERLPDCCGKAVVAAAANEYHEIGASMVSDILEQDGWQVIYLGANVPNCDMLRCLHEQKPRLLALSVTIPFNLDRVKELVAAIRDDEDIKEIKVLVGGRVFNENRELWQVVGADAFAADLDDIHRLTAPWRGGLS